MRITLSGDLGSGKSSVGRRLSDLLDIPYISAGKLFREIGQISNMDALTTNLAAETNTDIDAAVDQRTKDLDRSLPDFIIDSRMAWHFVNDAVRVFLSVCPETAAERVLADTTRQAEKYDDTQSALKMLRHRRDSELKRYKTLYNVDIEDEENYDLWIITDDADVDAVCEIVLMFADGQTRQKRWIPKTRLVPLIALPAAPGRTNSTSADAESAPLPLAPARNFGLYSGDAGSLISALKSEAGLVPFRAKPPAPLSKIADPIEAAKQAVTAKSLSDWEEAFGVKFAFRRCLAEAPSAA
jgi:CMP/dCMP kinase